MISKDIVTQLVNEKLESTDGFLVDVNISADNSIIVEIDSDTAVSLDFCVELSRYLENNLNRETEDFSLEVGSYGISKPFVLHRQFSKNIGSNVEILGKDGKKLFGTLSAVCQNYFTIEVKKKIISEGKKGELSVTEDKKIDYNDIKYCKLDF
ncbi:MAG: ribosome assembly cofactor RimP [Bacteroidales bacterium]|jgi:ribosome maturation factor RimP|nr:ribosome assembly cofactor RimP [Bacteroidales bacterium]